MSYLDCYLKHLYMAYNNPNFGQNLWLCFVQRKLAFVFLLLLSAFLFSPLKAAAISPEDVGLKEGDLISSFAYDKDPDIFIINQGGFKRLFLNQVIFKFYGHLHYLSVKLVKPEIKDRFVTSSFYRDCEDDDPKVYGLETTGEDMGFLHHVDVEGHTAASQDPSFFKKVFCINKKEFNWYKKKNAYASLSDVHSYRRGLQGDDSRVSPRITERLSIDPSSVTLNVGESVRVKAVFAPPRTPCLDATPPCEVPERVPYEVDASWASDNPNVAAVDIVKKDHCAPPRACPASENQTVVIRGVSAGATAIRASYIDSQETYTAQMNVTVTVLSTATDGCAKEPASSQNSCWQKMAEHEGDISFCRNITVPNAFFSHDGCVNSVAQAKKDSSLCASIIDPSSKQGCVSSITSGQPFPFPLPRDKSTY